MLSLRGMVPRPRPIRIQRLAYINLTLSQGPGCRCTQTGDEDCRLPRSLIPYGHAPERFYRRYMKPYNQGPEALFWSTVGGKPELRESVPAPSAWSVRPLPVQGCSKRGVVRR